MHDRLREIGKPTLARVNGIAVGGGNELQMACDLSVMVDDAFIRHVGLEHGSVPAGGATQWLPIMVGERRAREIVLLCEPIPAAHGGRMGPRQLGRPQPPSWTRRSMRSSTSWPRSCPRRPRYAKQQRELGWRDISWHETVGHARDWLALSMNNAEAKEAIEKFLKK